MPISVTADADELQHHVARIRESGEEASTLVHLYNADRGDGGTTLSSEWPASRSRTRLVVEVADLLLFARQLAANPASGTVTLRDDGAGLVATWESVTGPRMYGPSGSIT